MACMIAHDFNRDVMVKWNSEVIPVTMRYLKVERDAVVSDISFFQPIASIALSNIETYRKSGRPQRVKRGGEELLLPAIEQKLQYQGIDLIRSTVELISDTGEVKMNALQWCVYSRHFLNGEPLLNLCVDLPSERR